MQSEKTRQEHADRYGVYENIKKEKKCLRCNRDFLSTSKFNRVCYKCKKINEETQEDVTAHN